MNAWVVKQVASYFSVAPMYGTNLNGQVCGCWREEQRFAVRFCRRNHAKAVARGLKNDARVVRLAPKGARDGQ